MFHKDGGSNFGVVNCMYHFSMFIPTKYNVKLANVNMVHDQVIDFFCVAFFYAPLYIQWGHFIIVQVTLPIPFYFMPINIMSVFKRLNLNLLNIVVFCNFKVVLGDRPTGIRTI